MRKSFIAFALVILCLTKATAYTVEERIGQFGKAARLRWKPYFKKAGINYPPKAVVLYFIKSKKILELYAGESDSTLKQIRQMNVRAASGGWGPKLREGDGQVPEGIYKVELLNPNSSFHVSLRVSYPNTFDREMAKVDKRQRLGGDIMIHGSWVSIGCLAMGDEVAEDLFSLAVDSDYKKWKLIFSPVDLRKEKVGAYVLKELPKWVPDLYEKIKAEAAMLPL